MNLAVARGAPAEMGMLFSGGPYFFRVLGAAILFWTLVIVGLALFIVPGIYVLLTYWPYKYFLVDTDCSVSESFRAGAAIHAWSSLVFLASRDFIRANLFRGTALSGNRSFFRHADRFSDVGSRLLGDHRSIDARTGGGPRPEPNVFPAGVAVTQM